MRCFYFSRERQCKRCTRESYFLFRLDWLCFRDTHTDYTGMDGMRWQMAAWEGWKDSSWMTEIDLGLITSSTAES